MLKYFQCYFQSVGFVAFGGPLFRLIWLLLHNTMYSRESKMNVQQFILPQSSFSNEIFVLNLNSICELAMYNDLLFFFLSVSFWCFDVWDMFRLPFHSLLIQISFQILNIMLCWMSACVQNVYTFILYNTIGNSIFNFFFLLLRVCAVFGGWVLTLQNEWTTREKKSQLKLIAERAIKVI